MLEPRVLVATKAQKINIIEVKENPPQSNLSLLRKQPKPPGRVWTPLSSLKKKKPRRAMQKNKGTRGWNICGIKGKIQLITCIRISFISNQLDTLI